MLFYSPTFIVFLVVFLAGLWLFRREARIVYCCVASYIFYGWWYPPYVVLLFALTVYAHIFARIEISSRPLFGAVVLLGLVPLVVFKYTGFVFDNIDALTGFQAPFAADWALPIGISFISFTAIAYIVDSRNRVTKQTGNFLHTGLFISFFPQLIAGPILRANELMPQITGITLNPRAFKLAFLLFALGAFKKVGIADQVAPFVDKIYSGAGPVNSPDAVMALYAFSVQIYCDFSGYTDMALALGFLLNVSLPENFHSPYMAASIREFWTRWHMTLSRWLRDYLYIPLGGSRHGARRTGMAVMVTMLLGGLWHGAAWSFLVWGGLHGVLIMFERLMAGTPLLWTGSVWFRRILIFHFVTLAWAFFRAPSIDRAIEVLAGLFNPGDFATVLASPLVPLLVIGTILLHPLDTVYSVRRVSERLPGGVVFPLSVMLILIHAALSVNNPSAFIYFDF
jgi:alginate O-acetyltransferase complex protein AlgI